MEYVLNAFLPYLLLYRYYALFAFGFIGGVGVPLPVSLALVAVGSFAGFGYFDFRISFAVAVAANVLADVFDYALARQYGYAAAARAFGWERGSVPPLLRRLERQLELNAGRAVFVTRFAGSLSPITSLAAGFARIPFLRFFVCASAGNAAQIGLLLSAGYVAGDYWESASDFLTLAGGAAVLAVLGWIAYSVYRSMPAHDPA